MDVGPCSHAPNYQVLLESKDGLQTINVNNAEGIGHTLLIIRKKLDFEKWRVVNITEHLEKLP